MTVLAYGKRFWMLPILLWGGLALLSAQWNLSSLDDMAENLAYERAKSMFKLVQMTRLWNAQHGGVYVPITDHTPSNPYLEDPVRDVETTSGVKLTKLNPAYMTRQIADVSKAHSGILFHITSLKPINPGNTPDPWEAAALSAFEQKTAEVLEFISKKGKPFFRYMGPLFTKKACMKCHAKQGYEVGDVRGGISVTLPAGPILDAQAAARSQVTKIHISAFILLTITTLFLLSKLQQQWRLINDTKEQLISREYFLRSITEAAGEGVITLDINSHVTFANPEAKRLLGWNELLTPQNQNLNSGAAENTLKSYGSLIKAALSPTAESDQVVRVDDSTFLHQEGHSIPISYVASPILEDSKISGTVILFQDISLRKEMEKTLVRSETMSALGGMVAGVAHEVNTPLGVSVTSASYLSTKTSELLSTFENNALTRSGMKTYIDVSTESTTIILSNLERASKMIKSFKQIAADQASEALSKFLMHQYLDNVLLTLRPELKRTNLKIIIHCPEDIEVESYPGALSQILTNLILNSKIHGFDEGQTGTLKFDIKVVDKNLCIQYSDNGKGIPSEILESVFDPFFTTNRGNGSSGLGLHISHNLVHTVLQGTITISSKIDQGTTFTIVFPLLANNPKGQ